MIVLFLIAACLSGAYLFLLLYYFIHWQKTFRQRKNSDGKAFLSVVIAARNEEANIEECLHSVLQQTYPADHFEVIVVDDRSEDQTAEVVRRFTNVHLLHTIAGKEGKKAALSRGIQEARGDIILTTDADCTVSPQWLSLMKSAFTDETQFITAPVLLKECNKSFDRFQALDIASLAMVTGAGIESGLHHLANGANMAFRKSAYAAVHGFHDNQEHASGDDLFLAQNIAKQNPGGVSYVADKEAIAYSFPIRSLDSFIQQRLRWATKNVHLPEKAVLLIWAFIWITYATICIAFIASLWVSWQWVIATCLIITCIGLVQYIMLRKVTTQYGQERYIRAFPMSFLIHFSYVLAIGALATFTRRYSWKDRKTR